MEKKPPNKTKPPRPLRHLKRVAHVSAWVTGIPALLVLALYIALLIGPIPLPFIKEQAEIATREALPDSVQVVYGDAGLALESGFLPVLQFSPVTVTDSDTGSTVEMDALDVGFAPLQALFGRPAVSVTLVRPKLQIIQDLFGPRLAGFELVDNADGNDATIWVIEGDKSLPSVRISAEGLNVLGTTPEDLIVGFRSDNDWLIYNLQATADALGAFEEQALVGRFSRLRVRGATLGMHDSVFGLYRQFTDVDLDVSPATLGGAIRGRFEALLAGRRIEGSFRRTHEENGETTLQMKAANLDFASLLPFIDDPDGVIAIRGAGELGIDVTFNAEDGAISKGVFEVDMSGTSLRVRDDLFPVITKDVRIEWNPATAQFNIDDAYIQIGESSGNISGIFVMGLDEKYGPTISMSMEGRNVFVQPYDMEAPAKPFDEIAFTGWSAPLYGAIGIDQTVIRKEGMLMRAKGRADMVRSGIGIDMEIAGQGVTADDLKRLWPYFIASAGRDWFVENVTAGSLNSSTMRLKFPVGTISLGDEAKPIPEGALRIDMEGRDVRFIPVDTIGPVAVEGKTRVTVRDNVTTASMQGATIDSGRGPILLKDVAFIIDSEVAGASIFEISGGVRGEIPALMALIEQQSPKTLAELDIPIDPGKLKGHLDGSLVATIVMDENSEVDNIDYAANGSVADFSSSEPVGGYPISNGNITFALSQEGYNIGGNADIAGVGTRLGIIGKLDEEPEIVVSAELDAEELIEFGFDATDFLSGKINFAARPLPDGRLQFAADITNASLNVADLGIEKEAGVPGELKAIVLPDGEKIDVSDIEVRFDDVDIQGQLAFDLKEGLESAEFTTFKLSPGDDASLVVSPTPDGIALKISGEQLDLKPMLKRFFALDQASTGGPQSTQFDMAISLDVKLAKAIGFYRTIAYNFDLQLDLNGEDLRNVSMQTQFTEGSSVSVATNPSQNGRTMSIAFNDAGTLLRFLNVYSRLLGGQGSLTMVKNISQDVDRGQLTLTNFSLVDEAKVAEILGNHKDSRSLIANQNRLNFKAARVQFVRRSDRIEVVDAVLTGDTVGGTARGFVYTKARKYDLTGTYVPLFGLNSIFQKLPILGPLLGGRDGEGLVGVTFAVRGDLDNPSFLVNPASILLPGAFRSLMEFRAKEAPREQ